MPKTTHCAYCDSENTADQGHGTSAQECHDCGSEWYPAAPAAAPSELTTDEWDALYEDYGDTLLDLHLEEEDASWWGASTRNAEAANNSGLLPEDLVNVSPWEVPW